MVASDCIWTQNHRTHVLTIALEDSYQVRTTPTVILENRGPGPKRRPRASTPSAYESLEPCGTRATYLVPDWVANAAPRLVRKAAPQKFEIPCRDWHGRWLTPCVYKQAS
jgi:hypothetical protein